MDITTIKRSNKILKELNQKFNRDKQFGEYSEKNLNLKVAYLAKGKIPVKSFGHIIDIISKNDEAKAILKLFSNMLGAPRSELLFNKNIKYPPLQSKKYKASNKSPIGIVGINWINTLLQFMISIPSIRNMFNFTPKSFFPFNLFIDTYETDKQKGENIASINSDILFDCLIKKFNEKHFITNRGKIDLYKILSLIMSIFYEDAQIDFDFINHQHTNLLSFRPSWQILFDIEKNISLESHIYNILCKECTLPKELLISFRWFKNGKRFLLNKKTYPKKKFLFFNEENFNSVIYDLDSFIEYRQDGSNFGRYITYIKENGVWYQCDDVRVIVIQESNIELALTRSILLHYNSRSEKSSIWT